MTREEYARHITNGTIEDFLNLRKKYLGAAQVLETFALSMQEDQPTRVKEALQMILDTVDRAIAHLKEQDS